MLTKSSGFSLATTLATSDRLASASQQRTSSFKTTSREKRPAWINRFVKDSYDLVYEPKDQLIRESSKQKIIDYNRQLYGAANRTNQSKFLKQNKRPKTHEITTSKQGYNIVEIGKNNEIRGISSSRYSDKILKKTSQNQDKAQKQTMNKIAQQATGNQTKFFFTSKQGLSDFEYGSQTIIGKAQKKSNLHIAFQKKQGRTININKHWYNFDEDIDFQIQKHPKVKVRKCHSFKSYLPHQTFKAAQSLDKFYEIDGPLFKFSKPAIQIGRYDMSKAKGRPDLPKKEGTQLQYYVEGIYDKIKERSIGYKLANSERKIVFSKQVINPEKGCYR